MYTYMYVQKMCDIQASTYTYNIYTCTCACIHVCLFICVDVRLVSKLLRLLQICSVHVTEAVYQLIHMYLRLL